jgi:Ni/Co efflux regulator RcnB
MRRLITAALLAAALPAAFTAPATAQSREDQARWDDAQARYNSEFQRYLAERDRYNEARFAWRQRGPGGPGYGSGYGRVPPPPPPGDDRYENGYDPSQYYRPGPERVLAPTDRVYAGQDGRYYCKRSDGTTGLIAGGAAGGVLGNVIDGGHSRTAGTLIGAAIGALAGKAVDQNQSQLRCQ